MCYDVDDGISLEKSSGKTVSKGDVMRVRLGKDNVIEMLTPDVDASGSEIIIDAKAADRRMFSQRDFRIFSVMFIQRA